MFVIVPILFDDVQKHVICGQRQLPLSGVSRANKVKWLDPSTKWKLHLQDVTLFLGAGPINPAWLSQLLMIAGDVQPNPCPVKWPCGACGKSVNQGYAVECVSCDSWISGRCTALSTKNIPIGILRQAQRAIYQLRLNRLGSTASCQALIGQIPSPTCPHCGN